jgi:hypothetical protein
MTGIPLKPEDGVSREASGTSHDRLTCALPVQLVANPVLWPIRLRQHPRCRMLETSGSTRFRVVRMAEVDVRVPAHVLAHHVALISSQVQSQERTRRPYQHRCPVVVGAELASLNLDDCFIAVNRPARLRHGTMGSHSVVL